MKPAILLSWFVLGLVFTPCLPATQSNKQRISDIRRLGRTDSQAIPALAQNLDDPDPNIRLEAVKAIVKIGTERSLDPLVKAANDNSAEVGITATNGLVDFYMPGYVAKGPLTGPLTRSSRQLKGLFATRNRQEIDPGISVRPNIEQALATEISHAPSEDARTNAARAAGILRARGTVAALIDALQSKDTELMLESLYALQKIGDPDAGLRATFLVRDLDSKIQLAALETVAVLRTLTAAPAVRDVLNSGKNDRIRRGALGALAMFGIPGDRALFQQYAADPDAPIRAAALEGLGRIREPEDYHLLDDAFNQNGVDWRIHLAAAFGLVNEGKVDATEFSPLAFLVENVDQPERSDTASAYLSEVSRRDSVRAALYTLIPATTTNQKIALCSILASTHADDALPVLQNLQRDPNTDLSRAAMRAIRALPAR